MAHLSKLYTYSISSYPLYPFCIGFVQTNSFSFCWPVLKWNKSTMWGAVDDLWLPFHVLGILSTPRGFPMHFGTRDKGSFDKFISWIWLVFAWKCVVLIKNNFTFWWQSLKLESCMLIIHNLSQWILSLIMACDHMSFFLHFPAVYGMSFPQGFIRRKRVDFPRIDHQAQTCYKTFKIGRNTVICRPNEAIVDGQNFPLIQVAHTKYGVYDYVSEPCRGLLPCAALFLFSGINTLRCTCKVLLTYLNHWNVLDLLYGSFVNWYWDLGMWYCLDWFCWCCLPVISCWRLHIRTNLEISCTNLE